MDENIRKYNDIKTAYKDGHKFLYFNIYGWSTYLTDKPTFSTPTGKLWNEGFPRVVKIVSEIEVKPTKKTKI